MEISIRIIGGPFSAGLVAGAAAGCGVAAGDGVDADSGRTSLLMAMGRSDEAGRDPSAMVKDDAAMLAVTLLLDRDRGAQGTRCASPGPTFHHRWSQSGYDERTISAVRGGCAAKIDEPDDRADRDDRRVRQRCPLER
ncbi:hypothetical protein ACFLIM_42145 [Nonomuraea sp. M3C6]|uniref:Lipoprotein n=1 Tax=Nonomuraea marmarensis TaxID=3351344 RepID=A0ABW7ARZ8_9ACTN